MSRPKSPTRQLTLGQCPSPEMSVNSDLSLGTKKVIHYNSNSMKFFPKEENFTASNLKIDLSASENVVVMSEVTPNRANSPSPKRSAIRMKGKSGTVFNFGSNQETTENEDPGARTFAKKKTIKFGEKDEVKFFTMKEMSSKHNPTEKKPSRNNSMSSKNVSSNSRKHSSSNTITHEYKQESNGGIGHLFKNRNGVTNIGKSITVLMIINHFMKQMKLKSGRFGKLGLKQLKILNDLGHNDEDGARARESYEFEPNIMARMIKKFRNQQNSKNRNVILKLKEEFKEMFEKLKGELWVILPNNRVKIGYNLLILVFTLLEFIYIPMDACFEISEDINWYQPFRKIVYIFFMLDIFLNLNTGYFTKGTLILERKTIIAHYFKFRFWVDLGTLVPVFAEALAMIYQTNLKFIEFLFLIRIFFLNEMIRKICDFYNSGEFINSIIGLIKLCILTLYVAHICACLWYYISIVDSGNYQITWISIFLRTEEDLSFSNKYITSLYWAVTTMITVGYGDIVPKTPNEKIFAITSMLVACCVFAYIMNSIGLVISSFNNRQATLRHKIQAVNKYLEMKNIDYDLRIRIRKYLEYLYEEKNALVREGQTVVANLSSALKTEIFQRLNGEIIGKIPILIKTFTPKLLTQLTLLMKEVSFTPEDLIFSENDLGNQELFFIYEGEVEIFIENFSGFKEDTFLKKLKKGDYFGEISFFSNLARSASVKSLGFSNLISLSREDFLGVIRSFSYDYEKYCMISDNIRFYRNYYAIQIKCFCCGINNHISIECPMVHVVMNKDRIVREFIYSEPNERELFPRRKTPKFKVLANLQKLINATLKIHRTTTFELDNLPDGDDDDDDDNTDDDEEIARQKFQRNSRFMSGHSNKEKQNHHKSHMLSIVAPYRKSRSYTKNMVDAGSNFGKFSTNSVIYEETNNQRHTTAAMINNRSKDTFLTEIKLITPDNNALHSSSNRTSLFSPQTNANPTSNPGFCSYFSMTGANLSTIEKKQETYCISDAGGFFTETLSPSKYSNYNSNYEPISQNDLIGNDGFSEDMESFQSSLVAQKSKASKKSEILYSTIVSQNQKSSNSLNPNPTLLANATNILSNNNNNLTSTGNITNNLNIGSNINTTNNIQNITSFINNNVTTNMTKISKKDKKKDEIPPANVPSTTVFLQNNYFQIVSKAREDFDNNFDKMKIFDVYFPQNNVNVILEEYKKYQKFKNRKSIRKGKHGANPYNDRTLSTLIKNLPIFKRTFGTLVEDKTHNSQGDGNFRKRKLSELSFTEREKSFKPSKSLRSSKTLNGKGKLCKLWVCVCCKKPKMSKDFKNKSSIGAPISKRMSVAERLRRASLYGPG